MIDTYNEIPEELEEKCWFCGDDCNGQYCSKDCKKAYEEDN